MKTFEIYTTKSCPYCVEAKKLIKNKGHTYIEYNVPTDATKEHIQKKLEKLGVSVTVRTVPQIFVGNEYIGGHDELVMYFNNR